MASATEDSLLAIAAIKTYLREKESQKLIHTLNVLENKLAVLGAIPMQLLSVANNIKAKRQQLQYFKEQVSRKDALLAMKDGKIKELQRILSGEEDDVDLQKDQNQNDNKVDLIQDKKDEVSDVHFEEDSDKEVEAAVDKLE